MDERMAMISSWNSGDYSVSELAAQKLGKGLDPHREKETRAKETQPEQAQ